MNPAALLPSGGVAWLSLAGALQGTLLSAAVLSSREGPRKANRLLGLILLCTAFVMVLIVVSHSADLATTSDRTLWVLEFVEYSLWWTAGPLLWLYVASAMGRPRPTTLFAAVHFLPAALWLFHGFAVVFGWLPQIWWPPALWMVSYQVAYTLLSVWAWFGRGRFGTPAAPSHHDFWVPAIFASLALQHLAQGVRWAFRDLAVLKDIVPLAASASFLVVTFLGLRQALPRLVPHRQRYASSSLSPARARLLAQRLEALMVQDRAYLHPRLSLEELAGTLDAPKTHLSQVLNETVGETFLDYVGRLRIEEATRLLTDRNLQHLTIEAVAHRSGFRSRSTFYEAFRKAHGSTPAEYRRTWKTHQSGT